MIQLLEQAILHYKKNPSQEGIDLSQYRLVDVFINVDSISNIKTFDVLWVLAINYDTITGTR